MGEILKAKSTFFK